MNKRFSGWIVLVMLSQGCAGCGRSDSSPIPLAPSVPTPAPVPPSPQGLVDLTGDYTLTFDVGGACEEIPREFRTRTYEARISYYKSVEAADWFRAELSGATFYSYYPVLIEVIGSSVGVDLTHNVIIEEPSPGLYIATAGHGVASVQPTDLASISGSFAGFFKHCVATSGTGATNQCSVDTMVRGMCSSENSRWTLTRR
jgi:hypothetical protein